MSVKLLSPLVPPAMTTTQRDAIPAGRRPPGSLIFNTTTNRIETNYGTDATPSWSPLTPWVKINEVTLAAPQVPIDFPSIPQTFKHLLAVGFVRGTGTGVQSLGCRFNADGGNGYGWAGVVMNDATPSYPASPNYASQRVAHLTGAATDVQYDGFMHFIPAYTLSQRRASVAIFGGYWGNNGGGLFGGRYYGSSNPLSQLTYFIESYGVMNLDTGSTVSLYGLG